MLSKLSKVTVVNLLVFQAVGTLPAAAPPPNSHWVVSWGASPSPAPLDPASLREDGLDFNNQTVRQIVHLSLGGSSVRVRFSNIYGKQKVTIGAARLALQKKDSEIAAGSDRPLTFSGGLRSITIPANSYVVSDPVQLNVSAGSNLAISLFLPGATSAAGIHYSAQQLSYTGKGDQTAAAAITEGRTISSWVLLAGVDVQAASQAGAIAVLGDSITDGDGSTENANHRWPDVLASRLAKVGSPLAVLNAGIAGNRILHNTQKVLELGENSLARIDRDVFGAPGVRYLILLQGGNDIGLVGTQFADASENVTVQDLIAGMRQMIQRARDRGIKVFGGTITPREGSRFAGIQAEEKAAKRKALNDWIRTGGAFDGVFDFDKVLQDPASPGKLRAAFDSGDHLHPNDAGYKAMADSIDLSVFR